MLGFTHFTRKIIFTYVESSFVVDAYSCSTVQPNLHDREKNGDGYCKEALFRADSVQMDFIGGKVVLPHAFFSLNVSIFE